jgi:hypothetical protein
MKPPRLQDHADSLSNRPMPGKAEFATPCRLHVNLRAAGVNRACMSGREGGNIISASGAPARGARTPARFPGPLPGIESKIQG